MRVPEILETCLYVDDLEAAERFYGTVLGLELLGKKDGRHLFFRCGRRMLLVFDPHATLDPSAGSEIPPHGAVGEGHIAFAVPHDGVEGWRGRLEAHLVAIESEVSWPNGARSLYFRDPSGNSLELATPDLWRIEEGEIFSGGEQRVGG